MNDLNRDLSKRFLNYLDTKQYKRLQFEAEMMGEIENLHPLIIFYYASSIFLIDSSRDEDLSYASSLFEQVYLLNKNKLQPLYNMIAISFKTRVFKNVLSLALDAYEKNKQDTKLIEGLARINFYLGNRKNSLEFFRMLYKILPEKTEGRLPFITSLNYTSGIKQEEYLEECKKYTSLIEQKLDLNNDDFDFNYKKKDKIKLAFLSADFKTHSVSHFLLDLLRKIDKSTFEISLVSNLKIINQDETTNKLKELAENWYDIEDYSDHSLTTFLRSLSLDFLIDLSGYTHGNRFEVVARRCAKHQIEWLGYNNSLCLKNLDYLIADPNLIFKNEENLYSEKILFLPNIWNALSIPENLPEINDDIKSKNKIFTFCSFNNFQKISNRTIEVWSRVLKNSESQILLKDSLVGGEDLKNNILNKFLNNGVKKNQLIFLDREKKIDDHLKLYNKANLALDTFPFPGVTTSYEAILMGLPVLTMKGFNFNSRCGESINKNIDLHHFIANDDDDYVNKAQSLMKEKNLHGTYGNNLRKKAISSPLFDTDTFAKDFENLLKKIIN